MANFAVKSGGAPEPHGGRFASAVSKEPTGSMPNSWKRLQAANLSSRLWPSWRCRCPLRQIKVVSGITSLIQSGRSRARSLCGKPECRTGAPDHQFQGALAGFALQSLALCNCSFRHRPSKWDPCFTSMGPSPTSSMTPSRSLSATPATIRGHSRQSGDSLTFESPVARVSRRLHPHLRLARAPEVDSV